MDASLSILYYTMCRRLALLPLGHRKIIQASELMVEKLYMNRSFSQKRHKLIISGARKTVQLGTPKLHGVKFWKGALSKQRNDAINGKYSSTVESIKAAPKRHKSEVFRLQSSTCLDSTCSGEFTSTKSMPCIYIVESANTVDPDLAIHSFRVKDISSLDNGSA